jgi:hypothetical protein
MRSLKRSQLNFPQNRFCEISSPHERKMASVQPTENKREFRGRYRDRTGPCLQGRDAPETKDLAGIRKDELE